jgi:hypothetical protein
MASDDFIGNGWAFPAGINRNGSVRLVTGTEEVDAAIRMILSTVPGERVMRPDFGCSMWEQLFAPLTDATGEQSTGTVHITVSYRVKSTNDVRNLVFPFYTIPTEEPVS